MKQLEQLLPFVRFYQPPDQLSQIDVVRAHISTAPFRPIIDRLIGAADPPIEIGRAAPICRPIGHSISRPVRCRPDIRHSIWAVFGGNVDKHLGIARPVRSCFLCGNYSGDQ